MENKKKQQKETFKIQMENYNRYENLSLHYECTFYNLNWIYTIQT